MALYAIEDLSFAYPMGHEKALNQVNITFEKGSFVVLCGGSGSGKTTLLRHLKQTLLPIGHRTGRIMYENQPIEFVDPIKGVTEVGMVFQNPDDQLVMDTVIQELMFGMENIGLSPEVMRCRLAEVVHYYGMADILHTKIQALSGGQKQLLNLCGALTLQPKVLIFDEPTTELDPIARKAFIQMAVSLHQEMGMTIIMSEHDLDDVLMVADRVIYMNKGQIEHDSTPEDFVRYMRHQGDDFMSYVPRISRLWQSYHGSEQVPLSYQTGRAYAKAYYQTSIGMQPALEASNQELPVLTMKRVSVAYERKGPVVLKSITTTIRSGEWVTVLGPNGSGKSTLLKFMTGQLKPFDGRIFWHQDKIGYVGQNTKAHFVGMTVREVLDFALKGQLEDLEWQSELVHKFGLSHLMTRHPYDISGGEQEKLAIVMAMTQKPDLLLLDEPTKGLDPIAKQALGDLLLELKASGTTIVCVTHDIEFAADYSKRALLIFDHELVYDGDLRTYMMDNHYYTTKINQVMKQVNPTIITEKDFSHENG